MPKGINCTQTWTSRTPPVSGNGAGCGSFAIRFDILCKCHYTVPRSGGVTNERNLQFKESELAWATAMLIYKSTCKVATKYCPEVVVGYLSTYQYDCQVEASKDILVL